MYRFFIDSDRKKAWVDAIKWVGWQPNFKSRICSAHFILGLFNVAIYLTSCGFVSSKVVHY